MTQPPDSSRPPQTMETLAERAASIQREHIAALRRGVPYANGHAVEPPAPASDPIVRSGVAELSGTTADLARRASGILAAHIAARRADAAHTASVVIDSPARGKKRKSTKKARKAKR